MKTSLKQLSVLSLVSLLAACSQSPSPAPAAAQVQQAVAPLPINRLAIIVADKTHAMRPDAACLTDVEDTFSQQLISKGYSLADRSDVATVMKEIGFQGSGMTDSDVAKLGKMLNVPAVLIVNITACRSEMVANTIPGTSIPLTMNGQTHHMVSHCKLGVRLVMVEKNQMVLNRSQDGTQDIQSQGDAPDGLTPIATSLAASFPPAAPAAAQ